MSAVGSTSGICAGVHVPTAVAGTAASVVASTSSEAIAPMVNGRRSDPGTRRNIGFPLLVARRPGLRQTNGSRGSAADPGNGRSPQRKLWALGAVLGRGDGSERPGGRSVQGSHGIVDRQADDLGGRKDLVDQTCALASVVGEPRDVAGEL